MRRAAGGVLNSQSEGAPATELADVRLGSTSASGAYSGGLPLADASSKSAASPSAVPPREGNGAWFIRSATGAIQNLSLVSSLVVLHERAKEFVVE